MVVESPLPAVVDAHLLWRREPGVPEFGVRREHDVLSASVDPTPPCASPQRAVARSTDRGDAPEQADRREQGVGRTAALVALAVVATVGVVLAVVLQRDGADSASETSITTATTARRGAARTEPPATETGAVLAIVKDLLERYTEVHAEIIADPRPVAADPDHRLRTALRALFTHDSIILKTDLDALEDPTENRHGYRPGPSGHLGLDMRVTKVEPAPDADTFLFEVCAFFDGEEYDLETGEVVSDPMTQVTVWFGPGEARRVDGRWLLVEFGAYSPDTQTDAPRGNRNTCPPEVER